MASCFVILWHPGIDIHPTTWRGDSPGGTQWLWEEHGGCAAAESVPAHGGPGAAGREAPSPVRAPLSAQTGEQEGSGEGTFRQDSVLL